MRTFLVTPETPEQAYQLLKRAYKNRTSVSGGMLWPSNWPEHNTLEKFKDWWTGYLVMTKQHSMVLKVTPNGQCDTVWMTYTKTHPNNKVAEALKALTKRDRYGRFAK